MSNPFAITCPLILSSSSVRPRRASKRGTVSSANTWNTDRCGPCPTGGSGGSHVAASPAFVAQRLSCNAPSGNDASVPGRSHMIECTTGSDVALSASSTSTTTASALSGTQRHSSGGDRPSPSAVYCAGIGSLYPKAPLLTSIDAFTPVSSVSAIAMSRACACSMEEQSAGPVQVPASSIRRVQVLIVDDSADAAASLTMLLELEDIAAQSVGDAEAALQFVEGDTPLLLLIDIGLPGMNGVE